MIGFYGKKIKTIQNEDSLLIVTIRYNVTFFLSRFLTFFCSLRMIRLSLSLDLPRRFRIQNTWTYGGIAFAALQRLSAVCHALLHTFMPTCLTTSLPDCAHFATSCVFETADIIVSCIPRPALLGVSFRTFFFTIRDKQKTCVLVSCFVQNVTQRHFLTSSIMSFFVTNRDLFRFLGM